VSADLEEAGRGARNVTSLAAFAKEARLFRMVDPEDSVLDQLCRVARRLGPDHAVVVDANGCVDVKRWR